MITVLGRLVQLGRNQSPVIRRSCASISGMATSVSSTKANLPYGWPISDRIKQEVVKQDVWTVFSPASGFVPKVRMLIVLG